MSFSSLSLPVQGLIATTGFAFATQAVGAAIFVPQQNERYYDLFGSIGFLSTTVFSLYFPTLRARYLLNQRTTPFPSITSFHSRQIIISSMTVIWAARLGSFLFQRIKKAGKDGRFDEIKKSPVQFSGAWFMQAVWISATALPAFAVNAIPPHLQPALAVRDYAAIAAWAGAFLFEVVADRQKSAWRKAKDAKEHDQKYISSGLWSLSRHPNYVGEIGIWTSVYLFSTRALFAGVLPSWFGWFALASPLTEFMLIRFLSGVPLLEKSADKKFGQDPEYQKYKRETPVFFPKLL